MEKKQTQIRLPSALYEEIKAQARKHNRSLNGQLMEFIQKGMKDGATEMNFAKEAEQKQTTA